MRVAAVVPRRSGKIPDEPFDLQRWCDSPSVAPFSGYALCAAAEAVEDAGIGGVGGGGGEGRSSSKESDQGQSNLSNRFQVDPTRAGVSIGSGMGHVSDVTHAGRLLERGKLGKKLSPFFVPRVLCNAAAGQVSMAHDFRGPNRTTATACAAGAHAVGDAFRSIQRGDADLMLAGGTEACVDAVTIGGFARARALADPKQMGLFRVDETEGGFGSHGEHPKHELFDDKTDDTSVGDVASKPSSPSAHDETSQDYSTACRPFARTRGGFVVGEGAGVMVLEVGVWAFPKSKHCFISQLVAVVHTSRYTTLTLSCLSLESLEHALKRGVTKIYAEIRGFGQAGDAHHVTTPPSDGAGAARAMRAALQDAGVEPDSVDYVNAHATGTAAGDAAECAALLDVFGDRFSSGALAVSSTKGAVGHLLGAAGAVEAAFCALALFSSQTPPTLHLDAGALKGSAVGDLKGNADASKPGSQKDASRALKSRPEFPGVPPPGADLVRDANRNNQKTIVAMTNSFGFGGTNASLVFVKAPPVE